MTHKAPRDPVTPPVVTLFPPPARSPHPLALSLPPRGSGTCCALRLDHPFLPLHQTPTWLLLFTIQHAAQASCHQLRETSPSPLSLTPPKSDVPSVPLSRAIQHRARWRQTSSVIRYAGTFVFPCVSVTRHNLREGRDLIGSVQRHHPRCWGWCPEPGGTQNLVALTDVCGWNGGWTDRHEIMHVRGSAHPARPGAPPPTSRPPPWGCVKKPKIAMDGERPTLFVPSVGRSPRNLRRKTNVFSCVIEQFGQARARGKWIWSRRREPWPPLAGATQGT